MNTLYILLFILFFIIGWVMTTGTKTQFVRLIDVFIYGPLLIYTSILVEPFWLKLSLLFIGTTTISYNLNNYIKNIH
jgi:hypothetical protein